MVNERRDKILQTMLKRLNLNTKSTSKLSIVPEVLKGIKIFDGSTVDAEEWIENVKSIERFTRRLFVRNNKKSTSERHSSLVQGQQRLDDELERLP